MVHFQQRRICHEWSTIGDKCAVSESTQDFDSTTALVVFVLGLHAEVYGKDQVVLCSETLTGYDLVVGPKADIVSSNQQEIDFSCVPLLEVTKCTDFFQLNVFISARSYKF